MLRARRRLRAAVRRSVSLLLASGVVPGLGLIGTRYRPFGVLLTLISAGIAGVATWWGRTRGWGSLVASLATHPDFFVGIAGAAAIGGLVWVYAVLLTRRGTESPLFQRPHRRAVVTLTAALSVLALAVSGFVMRAALTERSFVTSAFGSAAATSTTGKTATSKLRSGAAAWTGIDKVTVLLVGTDGSATSPGAAPRTSSISVVSIIPATGASTSLAVPVDLQHLPLPTDSPMIKAYPGGYTCASAPGGGPCTLATLWADAQAHQDLFKGAKNPGLRALRDEVEDLTGVQVDNVVMLDTSAYASLLGSAHASVPAGAEGRGAVGAGAAGAGAAARVNPACQLEGLIAGISPGQALLHSAGLAGALKGAFASDIPVDALPAWQQLLERVAAAGGPHQVALAGAPVTPDRPDLAGIRSATDAALTGAANPAVVPTPC